MYADITKPPAPLPKLRPKEIQPGVTLVPPLSRRGHGPGVIILTEDSSKHLDIIEGVPSPLIKWAEEGYTVVEIRASGLKDQPEQSLTQAIEVLKTCEDCDVRDNVGIVVYDFQLWNKAAAVLSTIPELVGAVIYADESDVESLTQSIPIPSLWHIVGQSPGVQKPTETVKKYYYPTAKSSKFATPFHEHFHYNTEAISHTRSLTFLKPRIGGPYFDLEYIWDEHTYYEFADRSVEHTMSTMVQEPYVNHVPTLTGGVGREALTRFYSNNFIFNNSADSELELISRTVGIDRVVDEFIFKFTHDGILDWLVPGVPPTYRKAEVPFTAVVNVRGDRLYHEHILWDQCTVLRQLGLMPEYLPYPCPLPKDKAETNGVQNGLNNGHKDGNGEKVEYRVPTFGGETSDKMRDRNCLASNAMLDYKVHIN